MGTYVVIEVKEPSHDPDEGYGIAYPFLLVPPILSLTSLCVFRDNGDWMYPRKIWILAIISMVITFAISIGVFFGVSYLSAAIPFMLFLWSGANLAHGIIGDIGSKKIKDFIEDTRIDIACFFCILFLFIPGATHVGCILGGIIESDGGRILVNTMWLACSTAAIHFAAIFYFSYLNSAPSYEKWSSLEKGIFQFGPSALYLLPAIPFLFCSFMLFVSPFVLLHGLEILGFDIFFSFFSVMGINAAFMIAEGILLIVGRGGNCAQHGISQGISNFILVVAMIASSVLPFTAAVPPFEVHIKNVSDFNAIYDTRLLGNKLGERKIYYYLDNDIDFNGETIPQLGIGGGDLFDGQGHKLINGVSNSSRGVFSSNSGTIKNLNLDHCIIYGEGSSGSMGAFVDDNSGTIENCHAVETYLYFSDNGYEHNYKDSVYIGGIAGVNYGTVKNCSFENSDLNTAFPYSILHSSWATFSEITNNKNDGVIVDCYFFGTHGSGVADFDPER